MLRWWLINVREVDLYECFGSCGENIGLEHFAQGLNRFARRSHHVGNQCSSRGKSVSTLWNGGTYEFWHRIRNVSYLSRIVRELPSGEVWKTTIQDETLINLYETLCSHKSLTEMEWIRVSVWLDKNFAIGALLPRLRVSAHVVCANWCSSILVFHAGCAVALCVRMHTLCVANEKQMTNDSRFLKC